MNKANALSRYPSINTRSEGGEGEMRSAIKYLQDLDDFYSQIARPRFGKRGTIKLPSDLEGEYNSVDKARPWKRLMER